ncbi:hypothetical protein V6N13_037444 [Hibiscus sabdariffa]
MNARLTRAFEESEVFAALKLMGSLKINFDKSGIFFGSNVPDERIDVVRNLLGVKNCSCPAKYLGLPAIVGCNKSQALAGDSLTIIKKLKSKEFDLSVISAHIWDIRHKMVALQECSFSFVPRQGNRAAHSLANGAFSSDVDSFWGEEVTAIVETIVAKDRC